MFSNILLHQALYLWNKIIVLKKKVRMLSNSYAQ